MIDIKQTIADVVKFESDIKGAKKSNVIKISDTPVVSTIIIKDFSL